MASDGVDKETIVEENLTVETVSDEGNEDMHYSTTTKTNGKKKEIIEEEQADDSEEDVEYEVEKIVGHRIYKSKVVKYEVKWKGYDDSENTMEAASTLHDDVPDLCIAYWNSLKNVPTPSNVPGGSTEKKKPVETTKETKKETKKDNNKKRPASEGKTETNVAKKGRKSGKGFEHVPKYMIKLGYVFPTKYPTPQTNWDEEAKKICVQASPKDSKVIMTYIEWKNEEKTIHDMKEVHEKIPEKLIAYYEERLQFI